MSYVIARIAPDRIRNAFIAASQVKVWSSLIVFLETLDGTWAGCESTNPLCAYDVLSIDAYLWKHILPLRQHHRVRSLEIAFRVEQEELAVEFAFRYGFGIRRSDSIHKP